MKRIGVKCKDDYLFQKIKLALRRDAECVRVENGKSAAELSLLFVDIDSEDGDADAVRMSRHKPCDLAIPFTQDEICSLVRGGIGGDGALKFNSESKTVLFKEHTVKLTELEAELLSVLLSERRFFSKEELLLRIWGEGADGGIVNVYVHYLREKLEAGGEKVIICARNKGYRINEKYVGKEDRDAHFD